MKDDEIGRPAGEPLSTHPLMSDDYTAVAKYLTGMFLRQLRHNEATEPLVERLTTLRDSFLGAGETEKHPKWRMHLDRGEHQADVDKEQRQQLYQSTIASLPQERDRHNFIEAYAKIGMLDDLAALIARDNHFRISKQEAKRKKLPEILSGGVSEFVNEHQSIQQAIDNLNGQTFEVVMTVHPTNVVDIEAAKALRNVGKKIDTFRRALLKGSGDEDIKIGIKPELEGALKTFAEVSLVPQKDGKDVNLTVRDESLFVLQHLDNMYEDLPNVYGQFDRQLIRRAGELNQAYDPESLKLKLPFSSWDAADKDGNNSITAETALEAVVLRKKAIISHYIDDLKDIADPDLQEWRNKLSAAQRILVAQEAELGKHRDEKGRPVLSGDVFDRIAADVGNISRDGAGGLGLHVEDFKQALQLSYRRDKDSKKLDLLRRVELFGFHFARMEYRENAQEYTRAVGEVLVGENLAKAMNDPALVGKDYSQLSEDEKIRVLTHYLETPGEAQKMLVHRFAMIEQEGGGGRGYSTEDARPITYHTIKRMSLARLCPDMIHKNVLAECDQFSQMLEAAFLQKAEGKSETDRAKLAIVPLFEKPEALQSSPELMRTAYHNLAYRKHLEMIAQDRFGDPTKIEQEIMLAHSDNFRVAGEAAARAYLSDAHDDLRRVGTECGVPVRFFEGKSQTDISRGGGRAISADIKQFGLYNDRVTKFTFQGADLIAYYTLSGSMERLYTRNLTHLARLSHKNPDEVQRSNGYGQDYDPALERLARDAMKMTRYDYESDYFFNNSFGALAGQLGYERIKKASIVGSRAGERPAVKASSIGLGAVTSEDKIMRMNKTRAISYSKACAYAGIYPISFGSSNLQSYLAEEAAKLPEEKRSLLINEHAINEQGEFTSKGLNLLYRASPTFRDGMDRIAAASVLTDFNTRKTVQPELLDHTRSTSSKYVSIKNEYMVAGALALQSITGKSAAEHGLYHPTFEQLQGLLMDSTMEHAQPMIGQMNRYKEFLTHSFAAWKGDLHLDRLTCAGFTERRVPPWDDARYQVSLKQDGFLADRAVGGRGASR